MNTSQATGRSVSPSSEVTAKPANLTATRRAGLVDENVRSAADMISGWFLDVHPL
jgi:hypothetical protein